MTNLHSNRRNLRLGLFLAVLLCCATVCSVHAQNEKKIVAVVNGRNVTQAEVDNTIFADLFALEEQIYALRKAALDNLVSRTLLETEAARQKISVAELRKQLTVGPVEVKADQVDDFYIEHARAFGAMSPDEARERIRLDLESSARMQKYRERLVKIRDAASIELLLDEPRLPAVSFQNSPAIGAEKPRVLIVEFSDFQCPYCRASQPLIRELTKTYKDDVRLVFKHLPLEIHSEAFAASQAAFCAGQQGAFWQYHDALFAGDDLTGDSLNNLAAKLRLDLPRFKTCISSEASRLEVEKDLDEARRFGINSTPTFVINGKLVRGALDLDQFKSVIDTELKRVTGSKQ